MKRTARALAALAIATAAGLSGTAAASAAVTPPVWQVGGSSYGAPDNLGDPSNVGTLSFFDSSGNQITEGSAAAGFSYVEVDGLPTTDLAGDRAFVVLYAATPQPATPAGSFPTKAITVKTAWPNPSAPGALATDANPLFSGPLATRQNDSLDDYAKSFPQLSTASGYAGVVEIRAFLTGADGIETDYASADLQVDSATDTWTELFPSASVVTPLAAVGTTTSVTVSPGSGIPNSSQTLTASVTAASGTVSPAGIVDFTDGATDLGTLPLAGAGGTATASLVSTALGAGQHTITATFTPTDSTAFVASSASAAAFTLTAPALGGGGAVVLQAPVATVAPGLVGPGQIGQVEQIVSGTWSGTPSPTFGYQWLRDGKAVAGATSSTYRLTSADYKHHISAQVTASNTAGSGQAVTSSLLPKVGGKPTVKNLKLKGSAVHGKKVQVSTGTWSVSKLSFSYQWKLNGKSVKGATKTSFTLPASSRHATLTLVVTAKETGYTTAVVTTKSVRVG